MDVTDDKAALAVTVVSRPTLPRFARMGPVDRSGLLGAEPRPIKNSIADIEISAGTT
ncbi:hypothetical protein [Streptomyces sp. NPDC054865]